MSGDLIALRTFIETQVWAMDKPALDSLYRAVLFAKDIDAVSAVKPRMAATSGRSIAGDAGRAIGVLPIVGILTPRPSSFSMYLGSTIVELQQQFREMLADPSVKTIVPVFDSPGGSIPLIQEFAEELRASTKPVIGIVWTTCASAAYWLASAASSIVITPSGEAGAIGVYREHEDDSALLDRVGVKMTIISAGDGKVDGNPYEPLSAAARANYQKSVDVTYARFVADVVRGRGSVLTAARITKDIGARMFLAPDAVRLGLVDRIDTIETAIAQLVSGAPMRRLSGQAQADADYAASAIQIRERRRAVAGLAATAAALTVPRP